MKIIEIWTRPNSSNVLTRQVNKTKGEYHSWKIHTILSDDDITCERFEQLKKEFTLLNTIVI
jgi:hypothetical protein